MGLLNTMETILSVMESKPGVNEALEPIVLKAVHHIFTESIIEFYEEALSLCCDLTSVRISLNMWKMLEVVYEVRMSVLFGKIQYIFAVLVFNQQKLVNTYKKN